jgi:hypothetical protein
MDLLYLDADGNYKSLVKQLEGQGVLPIHLLVMDQGTWSKPRQLQVVVAVYDTKGPNGDLPGKLLTTWRCPDILETPVGVSDNPAKIDHELPLQPGRYKCQIFLCDPSEPVGKAEDMAWYDKSYMPALKELPGMVYRTQLRRAIVH